ncbi:MAG TPA: hypothetical protein VL069_04740, partial [Opitutus sp.]|nr:hypothetical protein [Opitutus sp.]
MMPTSPGGDGPSGASGAFPLGLIGAAMPMSAMEQAWWPVGAAILAAGLTAGLVCKWVGWSGGLAARRRISLLRMPDCLLWEGSVELAGSEMRWKVSMETSPLSQKLFGAKRLRKGEHFWTTLKVADPAQINARWREALERNLPALEHQFQLSTADSVF